MIVDVMNGILIQLAAVLIFLSDCTTKGWFICPRNCNCKGQSVDCNHRGFKEFPTYFPPNVCMSNVIKNHQSYFRKLNGKVEYLNLSGNELHYLPDAIYNLQNLADLNLSWNQLHYVPETTLLRLWRLEKLDLSGNKFNRLSDVRGIMYLRQLKELTLQSNPITETGSCVPDDAIYSESISKLDLSKCMLTNINPCAFLRLPNLTHLYLSGNPLQQLTQIVSNSILHLEMSNCDIHFITAQLFENLPSLEFLDMSRNPNVKVTIPVNLYIPIYISESLIHLDASNCGMTELIVSPFPNLKYLSFKGNFIRELLPRLFYNNQKLISIDLSENLISLTHYGTFIGADSLKYLDLSSNFITDFNPGTFSHLYRLHKLNLSKNPLKFLNNISSFSLQYLDVGDCDIRELSPTFCSIPNISNLNISNNPIEYLPNELCLENIEELDLSYCRLIIINPGTFKRQTKLQKLNLRGNRLTNTFQHSVIESMTNVKEIIITNNPWQCRCNSTDHVKFFSFVAERSPSVDQQELTCLMPESQLQLLWTKACQETDTKEVKKIKSERHWTAFLVTLAIMSSIVVILLILRQNLPLTGEANTSDDHTNNNTTTETETSHTPYPIRSPIADILQLPTYEEAILLPKPVIREDSSNSRTCEAATWTSNQDLNKNDNKNEINITENCPLYHRKNEINVSSTSL